MVQYRLSGPDQWMKVGGCSVLFPGLKRKDSSDLEIINVIASL